MEIVPIGTILNDAILGYTMSIKCMKNGKVHSKTISTYRKLAQKYKKNVRSHELDHQFLAKFLLRLSPKQKILDMGTGTGEIANEISKNRGVDVVAIDASPEMLKIARKSYPNLKFRKMDLRTLKFKANSFDGIIANYSLIHLQDDELESVFEQVFRILRGRGFLYVAVQEPRKKSDKDGFYKVVYEAGIKLFINLFTETQIKKMLVLAGFRVIEINRRPPEKNKEFPFNKLFIVAQK